MYSRKTSYAPGAPMRRLLALAFAASAFVAVAPAHANYTCEGTAGTIAAGACVQVGYCQDVCFIAPGVYLYCTQAPTAAQAACATLNKVHVSPVK
jgi:hypothetical protein